METTVDNLALLDEALTRTIWFAGESLGVRIRGVSIKCEPTGYLMILKGFTAEGPKVAFLGARSLKVLWRMVLDVDSLPLEKWREDRFALDKNGLGG